MKKKKSFIILILGLLIPLICYRPLLVEKTLGHVCSCLLYLPLKFPYLLTNFVRKKIETYFSQEAIGYGDQELLIAELIQLKSILHFIEETQELQEFSQQYQTEKKIMTHIIMKNFSDEGHFFLIDAGSLKGVAEDMIAVYKNCLLGRVIKTYPYYSKIMCISDRSCRVAAYASSTDIHGILEGIHDDTTMHLCHISPGHKPKTGEFLLSSGEGLVFPRGFGLGRVNYICQDTNNAHLIAHIQPLIPFKKIDYCYLIQKGQNA